MSTLYARITILVIATTTFGLIWSHDHKPVSKTSRVVTYDFSWPCRVETVEPQIETIAWEHIGSSIEPLSALPAVQPVSLSKPLERNSISELPLSAERPESFVVDSLPFPLPTNIAVGEYRVIDQFGQLQEVEISECDLAEWNTACDAEIQNSYEITVEETRWHFIRIERKTPLIAEEMTPVKPSRKEVAAAWGQLLNFAGKVVEPAVDRVAGNLEGWLVEEELQLSESPREIQ